MATKSSPPIKFVVPGTSSSSGTRGSIDGEPPTSRVLSDFALGEVKRTVELRPTREGGPIETVEASPDTDVVVIEIAGGPTLVLNPETARDLLLGQNGGVSTRSARDGGAAGEINVPFRLQWRGIDDGGAARATRGSFGDATVSAFHVVTDIFKGRAADFTASKIVEKVDDQVVDGVYKLDAKSLPVLKDARKPLPAGSVRGPALVLLHGTFSTTQGTFQKLWANHPGHVDTLFRYYRNEVYALDHSTLGRSPVENALTLVEALQPDTHLHLVSHSRGGLVAEVLAKVCSIGSARDALPKAFAGSDYREQREALSRLIKLVTDRRIKVDRVVRVACPVRGTLLASKRLDAYVSVLKWSLKVAGVPIVPALVDFLGLVAQRRADVSIMPGLAAQVPSSPLVTWLNGTANDVDGDLRVIAGDLAGDSVTSWIKTLLSDAFYWTDNDLVVQTRGMYGGSPRAGGATFLLDQGGGVSHFNYFANERSADAVVNALTQPAPSGFRKIGPLSWAGRETSGVRGAPNVDDVQTSTSDLPAAILIPDILASHLRIGDERLWLSRRTGAEFDRLAYPDKVGAKVEPDGIVEAAYKDLSKYLTKTHEVIPFAYDWRLPIEKEAERLASVVEDALAARASASQAVRIVAHGMGGLVARALQFVKPKIWEQLLAPDDARILLLGVPNGGSWTPMQVLSGDETFGSVLLGLAPPFQDQKTRQILAGFPGFLQLQAGLTDPDLALADTNTWAKLAKDDLDRVGEQSVWHKEDEQIEVYAWGVPSSDVLGDAVAFRRKLDEHSGSGLAKYVDKIVTVVGTARSTPDGFENGDRPFVYRDLVAGGDGYITMENALIGGLRAWAVPSEHRSLTTNPDAFAPYEELLTTGTTKGLVRVTTSGARGAAGSRTYERSRPSRRPTAPPPAEVADLLSVALRDVPLGSGVPGPALNITVENGNLKFIRHPVMLGHYRSMALSGTEWVMDELIGGAMNKLVWLRQYPDGPRTHQIFVNQTFNRFYPLQPPRPQAVIVVGLGEEGKLTTTELTATVTHGVIAWAQRLVEKRGGSVATFQLAATLVGSGGAGISAGQSALAVAQGVREANLRLLDASWPTVDHLYLIELYLDRATEAWRALQVQATAAAGEFRITESVKVGTGALRRPLDSSYRGADYDFVTATTQRDARGEAMIAYRLDTKRARTEVRASAMQGPLLRELVVSASNDRNSDRQIGRTLFQLLIPPEMEPFLGGTTSMVLEVDSGSAGIPWELLDSSAGTRDGADSRPWAIRSKLIRKLRTDNFREQVSDADADAHVLVIGEPACDPARYPRLPAAQSEARAVVQKFVGGSDSNTNGSRVLAADKVKALISDDRGGADARSVMNTVLERDWRIVHIAGHGEPPEKIGQKPVKADDPPQRDGDPRGVVLSNGTFLGPREIKKMRVVPELVFVNCCHLAARNIGELLETENTATFDRAQFAAGVAEALIGIGVRCVIAAGWAVDDEPAKLFATTFYDHLLTGRPFIDAVAEARLAAQALGGNTWAAYQCYGDPDWKFRWRTGDAQDPEPTVVDMIAPASGAVKPSSSPARRTLNLGAEFASVASSSALVLALETIAIRSKYDRLDADDQRRRIGYLEEHFGATWGGKGEVAEAFGRACAEVGDRIDAVRWYKRAVGASDGSASMKATEQLGNLRARVAEEMVDNAKRVVDRLERSGARANSKELAAARARLDDYIAKGRIETNKAIKLLKPLAERWVSTERLSLCGSARKRRAMIERIAKNPRAEHQALLDMKSWYAAAERRAREKKDPGLYYPALNRMAAELVVDAPDPSWKGFDEDGLNALRANLDELERDGPDFWSAAGSIELRLYESLVRGDLALTREGLEKDYADLWTRVASFEYWDSVSVQLRFVLPTYIARATAAEGAAASRVLEHVRRLAVRAKRASKKTS